jgi:hypothetical protein
MAHTLDAGLQCCCPAAHRKTVIRKRTIFRGRTKLLNASSYNRNLYPPNIHIRYSIIQRCFILLFFATMRTPFGLLCLRANGLRWLQTSAVESPSLVSWDTVTRRSAYKGYKGQCLTSRALDTQARAVSIVYTLCTLLVKVASGSMVNSIRQVFHLAMHIDKVIVLIVLWQTSSANWTCFPPRMKFSNMICEIAHVQCGNSAAMCIGDQLLALLGTLVVVDTSWPAIHSFATQWAFLNTIIHGSTFIWTGLGGVFSQSFISRFTWHIMDLKRHGLLKWCWLQYRCINVELS